MAQQCSDRGKQLEFNLKANNINEWDPDPQTYTAYKISHLEGKKTPYKE